MGKRTVRDELLDSGSVHSNSWEPRSYSRRQAGDFGHKVGALSAEARCAKREALHFKAQRARACRIKVQRHWHEQLKDPRVRAAVSLECVRKVMGGRWHEPEAPKPKRKPTARKPKATTAA